MRRAIPVIVLVILAAAVGWSVLRQSEPTDAVRSDAAATSSSAAPAAPTATDTNESSTPATNATAPASSTTSPPTTTAAASSADLEDLGPRPELVEIDGWLQSDIDSLDELDGTVYAVQFWTYGCYNCKNTLPHMQELYAKYHDQGFEIVGVHSPEFDHEADPNNIENAAEELGVTWPIALDTHRKSFRTWQPERAYWPRLFLIDRNGNIRYDHIGEGYYSQIDDAVGALLAEPN